MFGIFGIALKWLGGLLGGPFAKAAVDAYKAKLTACNNSEKIAADLAGRELAVDQREAELQAQGVDVTASMFERDEAGFTEDYDPNAEPGEIIAEREAAPEAAA